MSAHPWEFYRGWLVEQVGRWWTARNGQGFRVSTRQSKKRLFEMIDESEPAARPGERP